MLFLLLTVEMSVYFFMYFQRQCFYFILHVDENIKCFFLKKAMFILSSNSWTLISFLFFWQFFFFLLLSLVIDFINHSSAPLIPFNYKMFKFVFFPPEILNIQWSIWVIIEVNPKVIFYIKRDIWLIFCFYLK